MSILLPASLRLASHCRNSSSLKGAFITGWYDINCQPVSPKLKQFSESVLNGENIQEQRQAVIEVILYIKKLSTAEFCAKYKSEIELLESQVGG
jgi:hypothetical protein